MKPPLILTAIIPLPSFEYFDGLRQRHFPAERNFLRAHLTLFHALPNTPSIINDVAFACARAPIEIEVVEPVSIGKGVAFKLASAELQQLHGGLRTKWTPVLTAQDQQKLWPHITIQNKVPATDAQALLFDIKNIFAPFQFIAPGLQIWEYLNGPWQMLQQFNFQKAA